MPVLQHRLPISVINNNTIKRADDETSVCSTLTVERVNETKVSRRTSTVRSVKFDFSKTVEYEAGKPIYEDNIDEIWYATEDYKQFKKSFITLARQFQSYDRTISDPQSFKTVLVKAFKACDNATEDPHSCRLPKADERALRSWLSKGSRRGVERISVLSIFADKSARRKKISAAVLNAQEASKSMDYETAAERIREAAAQISCCSRQFAWRLAL